MAPKKAKQTASPPSQFEIRDLFIQLGRLILRLICNFYLLVARYTGDGLHAIIQTIFSMILEVVKILLVLIARVLSEIFFGAALIIEKILAAILHLLLLLVLKVGSFVHQTARGLVDEAGYGISSAVFITITVLIWWCTVAALEEISHAIMHLLGLQKPDNHH